MRGIGDKGGRTAATLLQQYVAEPERALGSAGMAAARNGSARSVSAARRANIVSEGFSVRARAGGWDWTRDGQRSYARRVTSGASEGE